MLLGGRRPLDYLDATCIQEMTLQADGRPPNVKSAYRKGARKKSTVQTVFLVCLPIPGGNRGQVLQPDVYPAIGDD